jgi:hypothetical protein
VVSRQRRLPAGVDGFRLGGRHGELVERLDLAAELGVSVRELPTEALAELHSELAARDGDESAGWSA